MVRRKTVALRLLCRNFLNVSTEFLLSAHSSEVAAAATLLGDGKAGYNNTATSATARKNVHFGADFSTALSWTYLLAARTVFCLCRESKVNEWQALHASRELVRCWLFPPFPRIWPGLFRL